MAPGAGPDRRAAPRIRCRRWWQSARRRRDHRRRGQLGPDGRPRQARSRTLGGRPLLERSLAALAGAPEVGRIVLVVAPGREADAAALGRGRVVAVIPGGAHRGASVEAGFRALEAIWAHDAGAATATPGDDRPGRPRPRRRSSAGHAGARLRRRSRRGDARRGHPGRPGRGHPEARRRTVESTRPWTARISSRPRRRRARGRRSCAGRWRPFPRTARAQFTDEAALLEACTIPVHPIPGDPVNLKVTVPADLQRAEALLGGARVAPRGPRLGFAPVRARASRSGWAACEIPGAPRLHGHSDGDVALHAIADALLGAAALGDLGRLFPADRRTPRGIASTRAARGGRRPPRGGRLAPGVAWT